MERATHIPVLLEETIDGLGLMSGMSVVDATLGGGACTERLLRTVGGTGRVVALDWDVRAIERFREKTVSDPFLGEALNRGQLILERAPFSTLASVLKRHRVETVDAIVADLGLSSDQLDDPERGLSFRADGPLDMRLDSSVTVTAADIVNTWSDSSLIELLRVYGDEREARRIVRAILSTRMKQSLTRTQELAVIVEQAVSPPRRRARVHPATQTFQALRMAVNSERRELETFLPQALEALRPGGRLALISFHSGEDALVKRFLRETSHGCTCNLAPCVCGRRARLTLLSKKPTLPSAAEILANPRSRSAKLRLAEKII